MIDLAYENEMEVTMKQYTVSCGTYKLDESCGREKERSSGGGWEVVYTTRHGC